MLLDYASVVRDAAISTLAIIRHAEKLSLLPLSRDSCRALLTALFETDDGNKESLATRYHYIQSIFKRRTIRTLSAFVFSVTSLEKQIYGARIRFDRDDEVRLVDTLNMIISNQMHLAETVNLVRTKGRKLLPIVESDIQTIRKPQDIPYKIP